MRLAEDLQETQLFYITHVPRSSWWFLRPAGLSSMIHHYLRLLDLDFLLPLAAITVITLQYSLFSVRNLWYLAPFSSYLYSCNASCCNKQMLKSQWLIQPKIICISENHLMQMFLVGGWLSSMWWFRNAGFFYLVALPSPRDGGSYTLGHQNLLKGSKLLGPTPRVSDLVSLGWGLIMCILMGSRIMQVLLIQGLHWDPLL